MVDTNETSAIRRMQQGGIDCVLELEITSGNAPFQISDRRINNGSAVILIAANRNASRALATSSYWVEVSETNAQINDLNVTLYPSLFKVVVLGVPTSGRLRV